MLTMDAATARRVVCFASQSVGKRLGALGPGVRCGTFRGLGEGPPDEQGRSRLQQLLAVRLAHLLGNVHLHSAHRDKHPALLAPLLAGCPRRYLPVTSLTAERRQGLAPEAGRHAQHWRTLDADQRMRRGQDVVSEGRLWLRQAGVAVALVAGVGTSTGSGTFREAQTVFGQFTQA